MKIQFSLWTINMKKGINLFAKKKKKLMIINSHFYKIQASSLVSQNSFKGRKNGWSVTIKRTYNLERWHLNNCI
ncbi:Uncharacterized protein GY17_00000435 [Cryptosporidium hominis]|uniref:Uncharacterized protein n=1 Tax=Cryptosporidium hominis TaxID=237895 RepID=A0ABX5BH20_CRYHO|nr:hypothetical protein [Cryptosporidium hominis TU502]PPS97407.1 Uncharacterized protein GY17_00000435 [Cryptosporidium hominis]|eukprot:PPS97407.1 Uncharacterized protein GY17_00000435 [Cryptosporidium hominis]